MFLVLAVFLVSACNEVKGAKIKINGQNQTNQTQFGSLYASSTPSSASVYVDNVLKGLTPKLISNLSIGSHTIKFTKTGYYDYSDVKKIYANQITYINATLTLKNNQTNQTIKGTAY